jgi:protein ImuB
MIAYIHLPGFYLRPFDADPLDRPLLIVRGRSVLDVDRLAEGRGVCRGIGIKSAKAILEHAIARPYEPDLYSRSREAWLDLCTAFSDRIEAEDDHAAFVDLGAHPVPESVLSSLLRELERHFGFERLSRPTEVGFGVSGTKWMAKAAALEGDPERSALTDPEHFLGTLEIDRVEPIPAEIRSRLLFLGYRTCGEVASLPLATLAAQFGIEAHRVRAIVRGRSDERVQPNYPPDSLSDRVVFESPVEHVEEIERALRRLAGAIGIRLVERELQGMDLDLAVEFEDGRIESRSRRFTKPMQGAATILFGARSLLGEIPLEHPVASLRVRMPRLGRSRRSQLGLYAKKEGDSGAPLVLQELRGAFGEHAIRKGTEIPESRRQRLRRAWKDATGWS